MANKQTKEQVQDTSLQRVLDYFSLSKRLFGMGDNSPYDINELKEDEPYYKVAKSIADELEIDWKKMTHEESNRIMLALLDEYYNRIMVDKDYRFTMSVTVKEGEGK